MQVRNHPMMIFEGRPIWPPHWIWISGPDSRQTPVGEVGMLENVRVSRVFKNTLFLTVSMLDGNRYMGTLSFDNVHFARKVFLVFKEHIRQAIKDIGEIEIA